jgi:hypothetical protein
MISHEFDICFFSYILPAAIIGLAIVIAGRLIANAIKSGKQ